MFDKPCSVNAGPNREHSPLLSSAALTSPFFLFSSLLFSSSLSLNVVLTFILQGTDTHTHIAELKVHQISFAVTDAEGHSLNFEIE